MMLPLAVAQQPLPNGDLGVEAVQAIAEIHPFEQGYVDLDMVYDCAEVESPLDSLRVSTQATAHRRSDGRATAMDPVDPVVVDLEPCVSAAGASVAFEVRVTWVQGNFTIEDVLDIEVELRGEVGEGFARRATPHVSASHAVPMVPAAAPGPAEPEAEDAQDQRAPGPAIAWLAFALLAFARRR